VNAGDSSRKSWFRYGVWNTLEHGVSRGLDAFSTIVLLWFVAPEAFSLLAVSQAYVAPALFFFVSPEISLYPNFAKWSAEGPPSMLARVRIYRRFAWSKAALALGIAAAVAALFPFPEAGGFRFADKFFALVWAFSLPLAPQVSGADREFLRLNLDLRTLNGITFFQRAFYLSMLFAATRFFPGNFAALAVAGGSALVATAILARRSAESTFRGVRVDRGIAGSALIRESLTGFSGWGHVSGILLGWMQTLDLFFLGWLRFPATDVGLYSVALKLASFCVAVPSAIANLFNVYFGRTAAPDAGEPRRAERRTLLKASAGLAAFVAAEVAIVSLLAPTILELFSRGRWSPEDCARILEWLRWILPAIALYGSTLIWTAWIIFRRSFRRLFVEVYLPWTFAGAGIYGWAVKTGGLDRAAQSNLTVIVVLIALLGLTTLRPERSGRRPSA
jgi:hypothetical protein